MTQNNVANALSQQAVRTGVAAGADLLARAVSAYEAAMEVRTRRDQPQRWAQTQENLALLFEASAQRGTAPAADLKRALAHCEAALEICDLESTSYFHAKCSRLAERIREALARIGEG